MKRTTSEAHELMTDQYVMEPKVATTHQLASRTFLAGIMRISDFILLGVVILAARCLGAEQFGVFMFGLTLATVVLSPFSEAFTPTVAKNAARAARRVGADLGAIIPFQMILMTAFLFIGWMVMHGIGWTEEKNRVVLMMIAAFGLRGPLEVLRSAIRGLGRFDGELVTILVERLLLLATAAAVLLTGHGPLWLGACFVATRLVSIAVALRWLTRLGHRILFRWRAFMPHIRESWPYGVTKWVTANYDQMGVLCLGWLSTDAATGAFSAAFRLIDGISSFPQVLVLVLLPELTVRHGLAPQKVAPLVRKTAAYTALLTLPLAAGFIIEAPWLIGKIYGAKYVDAVASFQILSAGMLFLFTREIARTTLWALDREGVALWIMAAGWVVNGLLNILLIPAYGAVGASLALSVSALLVWAVLWAVLARRNIAWPWADAVLRPSTVALAVGIVLWMLHPMPWPLRLAGAAFIALAMFVVTKAISAVEWQLIRSLSARLLVKLGG